MNIINTLAILPVTLVSNEDLIFIPRIHEELLALHGTLEDMKEHTCQCYCKLLYVSEKQTHCSLVRYAIKQSTK